MKIFPKEFNTTLNIAANLVLQIRFIHFKFYQKGTTYAAACVYLETNPTQFNVAYCQVSVPYIAALPT